MQGKLRIFNLFARALIGVGQAFEETLRNMPPRISATNLRHYALGLKCFYKGILTNSDPVYDITVTPRQVMHAAGTISYKDCWGPVFDAMPVDRIFASNLEDRMWGTDKTPALGDTIVKKGSSVACEFEVILAYSPRFFGAGARSESMTDGMMAASLLGEEATIRFGSVGGVVFRLGEETVVLSDVAIRVEVVAWQTKELVVPIPAEYRDDALPATTNPYISTGDARKIEQLFVLSQVIGTAQTPVPLAGFGSQAEILCDLDGHVQYQGPALDLIRSIENFGDGAPFSWNKILRAAAPAEYTPFFGGEMYSLIDPLAIEKASQGQACKRLEVRGIGPMERADTLMMSRRRYECSSALFERFCDREGVSAQDRKDLRIAGRLASSSGLRRSEAIAVPVVIGSRKQRAE